MKNITLWMVGGIVLVGGAFFIPEQSGSMWPSVIWSSIAAAVYLLVFAYRWLDEITSGLKRRTIAVMLGVLIVGCGVFAVINYEQSVYQEQLLMQIRNNIEQDVAHIYINKPLHKTFRAYHTSDKDKPNMGQLFAADYDSLVTNQGEFLYADTQDDESLQIYLSKAGPDSVVLIAESKVADARNADFQNFSGASGLWQVRGILTSKGVDYEREN